MVVNFLGYEDYLKDLEFDFIGPEAFYKKCLYLRKTKFEQICMYMDVEIKLSRRLFDALFKMTNNTSEYHLFTRDYKGNGTASDNDRKIINRIKNAFAKAGFTKNIIKSKEHAGYKINTDVIPDEFVVTSKKVIVTNLERCWDLKCHE